MGLDEKRTVVFRFLDGFEIRYMSETPQRGDFVAHNGELWIVTSLQLTKHGTTVICGLSGNGDSPNPRSG